MRNQPSPKEDLINNNYAKPLIIQEVETRLKNDERLGINIGIQEGLLLNGLCSLNNVEKVVEIGTQYGCSATWMALALGKGGQIYTLEKDPICLKNCQITFQHPDFVATGCQVEVLEGDAVERLPELNSKGPFDLIFIDANKAAYGKYLQWARENIRGGGIIAIDNIYLFGTVFMDQCPAETPEKMWRVMREVIRTQMADSEYSTSIVPTEEGMMLSIKKS